MKKLFLKMFLNIIGIMLIVLIFQCIILFVANISAKEQWKKSVVEAYVGRLQETLLQNMPDEGWSSSTITSAFMTANDDRVSGILVSDAQGTPLMTLGKDPRGVLLSHPDGQTLETVSVKSHVPVYDVYLTQRQSGWAVQIDVESVPGRAHSGRRVPVMVRSADVAGSVMLHVNGTPFVAVDVLTFDPFTYAQTAKLFTSLLGVFFWTLPLSLLIALVLGSMVSRRNTRYATEISSALGELASGKHPIKLPALKGSEFMYIRKALAELDRELLQNERTRNAWIQSISHDLNTPVSAMKLLLEGISDGVFAPDASTISAISNENATLEKRIKSVITYASLQSPDTALNMQWIDVDSFVRDVLSVFEERQAARITVESYVTRFTGDASLVRMACHEVLDNALKASAAPVLWRFEIVPGKKVEEKSRRKKIIRDDSPDHVVLTVINEGELPAQEEDFFEPWSTGRKGRSGHGGSGLGLAITGSIVRLHKGTMVLKQMNSRGERPYVVLTLRLPLTPPETMGIHNLPAVLSAVSFPVWE
ncbi:sensor histidine kinase [Parasphaerochaeta coccoides]|uniref:histidine kinase n=1 Tax=Parasphaerochaeta coccoides (strain ATCC BAA-1237 / DSM 17374 / SPN1) TaxID=760011 RepID=F4GHP0_PARC1|nr:HAMP domain-containing sensor histidine kinase [Parasphaerochaeta coccoides]AEC01578.1 integral membrane sensor signal transduction histidine kinase [Parasphaerochaeta coccoides DSM 17374]